MKRFKVVTEPTHSLFHVMGNEELDDDLLWKGRIGTADSAIGIGLPTLYPGDTFESVIEISPEFKELENNFFAHTIFLNGSKFEIVDVVESECPGEEGIVGMIYSVPWEGRATFQFRTPQGFIEDIDGSRVPASLEILISPPALQEQI